MDSVLADLVLNWSGSCVGSCHVDPASTCTSRNFNERPTQLRFSRSLSSRSVHDLSGCGAHGDFAFRQDFDNVSNTIKVRQAGFHDCIDSETMFYDIYENLREMRILPRLPGSVSLTIPTSEVSTFDSQRKVS
jgi:hypothetical protein